MLGGLSRRDFLYLLSVRAFEAGRRSMAASFPTQSLQQCGFEKPNTDDAGPDRFFMDGGLVEFELDLKGIPLYKSDIIDLIPTVKIFHCRPELNYGIQKPEHIIDSVYELSFIPLARYRVPRDHGNPNANHYLLSIIGMFTVFHFNFTMPYSKYLKLGARYTGYGRISNTCKPWDGNRFISADEVRAAEIKGRILSIAASIPFYGQGCDDLKYCRQKKRRSILNSEVLNPYSREIKRLKVKAGKLRTKRVEAPSSGDISFAFRPIYEIFILQ